ncbi:MAG: tRNA pseudouridine(55) synthase TruB [Clostridiales bacterium]|nr:tRNA pseudouridine(55) synthase TruB [Clostridiales bacterium]
MTIDGVININKPAGWTSQDVCAKLKHALHVKKAGHTGTLDPMATGVLPVCVGKATRVIEYYGNDAKTYSCVMKLGIETDTLDVTGEALRTGSYAKVTEKAVREAFKAYTGVIKQTPPKYSALKIDGKRAYDLARSGEDFEIKPREITIYGNKVDKIDLENGEIEFEVTCSKGTYIRTICDDIGRTLGCGAAMKELTRTASGFFRIEDSYTIEEVINASTDAEKLGKMTVPPDITLEKLGKVILNDNRVTAFMNGNSTWSSGFRVVERSDFDEIYRVYAGGEFLGSAAIENGSLVPKKVFR